MLGTTVHDIKEVMARIHKHAGKMCMECEMRGSTTSRCTCMPIDAVREGVGLGSGIG